MLPNLLLLVLIPGQRFFSKYASNEEDLIVVIIIFILKVPEIAIHSSNPVAVGFRPVSWISFEFVGKINLLLLG
jgi:hypothetical protein